MRLIPTHHHTTYELETPSGLQPVESDWWIWLGRVFRHRLTRAPQ